jgi:predicted amino acid racemase
MQERRLPSAINNLRLGEILLLGRETAFGRLVEGMHRDAFILKGQIIELKEKPSVPTGTIGMDSFGNTPTYEDRGIIKRAIVGMGRQDVDPNGLTPLDDKIDIIGASSDHTILDVTQSEVEYKVGDIVEFYMDYGCLLRASTSQYVDKVIVK